MKYVTKDGINLMDVSCAGVLFGRRFQRSACDSAEGIDALDAALPDKFKAEQAKRQQETTKK